MNITVLRPPGCGNATQAKRLAVRIETTAGENEAISEQQELFALSSDPFLREGNQTGSAEREGSPLPSIIEITGAGPTGVNP